MAIVLEQLFAARLPATAVGLEQVLTTVPAGDTILLRRLSLYNPSNGQTVVTLNWRAGSGSLRGLRRRDITSLNDLQIELYDVLKGGDQLVLIFAFVTGSGPLDVLLTGWRKTP